MCHEVIGGNEYDMLIRRWGRAPRARHRAIYEENTDGFVNIVLVIEVNNHEY